MMGANPRSQAGFGDYLDLLRVFDEREAEALIVGGQAVNFWAGKHIRILIPCVRAFLRRLIVEAHSAGNCRLALNALQQLLLSTSNREVSKVARAHGFALLQTMPLADLTRSRHPKLLSFVAKRLPAWQQSMGTRGHS